MRTKGLRMATQEREEVAAHVGGGGKVTGDTASTTTTATTLCPVLHSETRAC